MSNCTAIPDTWKLEAVLKDCCLIHDKDYVEQVITRTEADSKFYQCALGKVEPITAFMLFASVTLGGWVLWYRRKLKKLFKKWRGK